METSKQTPPGPQERCPFTAALDVIGGKWSLIVLYFLSSGTRRFNELRRLMPAVSQKVLTATLRDLEREGLVHRTVYAEVPPRVEYSVTAHGETAQLVVEAMRTWGHAHLDRTEDAIHRAAADLTSPLPTTPPVDRTDPEPAPPT